ncbi:MAG: hypothetical protein VB063_08350 [Bacteroides graminisolvens]|nr:hypothetical protein [Bacteroides graminisolvens]
MTTGKDGLDGKDGKPGEPGKPGAEVTIIKGVPNVIAQYSQSEFGEYVRTISILTTAIVLHRTRIIIIFIRYFERNGG